MQGGKDTNADALTIVQGFNGKVHKTKDTENVSRNCEFELGVDATPNSPLLRQKNVQSR